MGGAENVVLALHEAFPEAPIYTSIYLPDKVPAFKGLDVRTTWLQKLPQPLRKLYKLWPTLQVKAFRDLDLSEFDIILTSSYLNANQVRKTRPGQKIISYCHTPARYYWSHYELYKQNPGFGRLNPLIRLAIPLLVPRQRKLDYKAAQKVDVFLANSHETGRRIQEYYGRESEVIYPPVDVHRFSPQEQRSAHFVTMGRQVPNKRFDLAVTACSQLNLPLIVFGNGPEHEKLVQLAGPSVEFRTDRFGDASDSEVEKYLTTARGFIFPSDEDFGIVTVEALAAGTPVIGYGQAGTLDIVTDGETGTLFAHQTVDDIVEAIKRFEKLSFSPAKLQHSAERFNKTVFINKIREIVSNNA